MFRLIYRQRRRILFGGFFAALAMFAAFFEQARFILSDDGFFWIAFPGAILIMAGGMMLASALFIAIFPRWRHLVELIPAYLFICAVAGPLLDRLNTPESLNWLIWFGGWMTFWTLTYGNGLDRLRAGLSWTSRRRLMIPVPAADLWQKFETRLGCEDRNWLPILHEVKRDHDDEDSFEVQYKLGPSVFLHETHTVLDREENRHFRYHFLGDVEPANRSLAEGVFDVELDEVTPGKTRVKIEQTQDAMLPRLALQCWFDDLIGDQLDSLRARLAQKRDWSITGLAHREILDLS